jgi:hypothetical protein
LCGCFFISTWRPLCAIVRLNTLLPTFHHNRLYFVFYQPPVDASMIHKALLIVLLTAWWNRRNAIGLSMVDWQRKLK